MEMIDRTLEQGWVSPVLHCAHGMKEAALTIWVSFLTHTGLVWYLVLFCISPRDGVDSLDSFQNV